MIKKTFLILFSIICFSCAKPMSQVIPKNLASEMEKLNVSTTLIVASDAIDYYPLWSPDSNFVAANIEGLWYKYNLTNLALEKGNWHNIGIGILITKKVAPLLTENEKIFFHKTLKYNVREISTSSGDKIELKLSGFSTSLILKKNGQKPEILWESNIENCHSLSISPNEKFVAYLCELNGLFVMKLK